MIVIDDAVPSVQMKEFVSEFQTWICMDYNVFLLMTGIHKDIQNLQNMDGLTFLYRAPKIVLSPLSITSMASEYEKFLNITHSKAVEMARMTRGNAYAYQILGYLCFKSGQSWKMMLCEFDDFLKQHVYDKIWSELSEKDQIILKTMAETGNSKVTDIRNSVRMTPKFFGVYRNRLLEKDILSVPSYGHLEFSLPRFREYILKNVLFAYEDNMVKEAADV